jgi:hypothetical protein
LSAGRSKRRIKPSTSPPGSRDSSPMSDSGGRRSRPRSSKTDSRNPKMTKPSMTNSFQLTSRARSLSMIRPKELRRNLRRHQRSSPRPRLSRRPQPPSRKEPSSWSHLRPSSPLSSMRRHLPNSRANLRASLREGRSSELHCR